MLQCGHNTGTGKLARQRQCRGPPVRTQDKKRGPTTHHPDEGGGGGEKNLFFSKEGRMGKEVWGLERWLGQGSVPLEGSKVNV